LDGKKESNQDNFFDIIFDNIDLKGSSESLKNDFKKILKSSSADSTGD